MSIAKHAATSGDYKKLAAFIVDECERRMRAYEAQPRDVNEHYETEVEVLSGGYAWRQLFELVQNAADAIGEAGDSSGRIQITLERDRIVAANTGAALDEGGIVALLNARSSSKRAGQIGRFGIGFKSLLRLGGAVAIVTRILGVREMAEEIWGDVLAGALAAAKASGGDHWVPFWANLADAPPEAASAFLANVNVNDLRFRDRTGAFRPRDELVVPSAEEANDVPDELALDRDFHAAHASRLPAWLLARLPPPGVRFGIELAGRAGRLVEGYFSNLRSLGWPRMKGSPHWARRESSRRASSTCRTAGRSCRSRPKGSRRIWEASASRRSDGRPPPTGATSRAICSMR